MAERIYTEAEIRNLSTTKTATPGLVYTDINGNKYIGTTSRNIIFLQDAHTSTYNPAATSRMSARTVGGAIDSLDSRLSHVEDDYINSGELDTAINSVKCLSIAMSMIF